MPRKPASVTAINQQAKNVNWQAMLADTLAEDNVKAAIVVVFYDDSTNRVSWSGDLRSSDLALASVRLAHLAGD